LEKQNKTKKQVSMKLIATLAPAQAEIEAGVVAKANQLDDFAGLCKIGQHIRHIREVSVREHSHFLAKTVIQRLPQPWVTQNEIQIFIHYSALEKITPGRIFCLLALFLSKDCHIHTLLLSG
jgi:hypothetical protein